MTPPIKNYKHALYPHGSVTQWFAENPDLYSRFGLAGHNGIDIVAPHGEPLYAVEDGTIIDVNEDPKGYGKHIRILSDENEDGVYRVWGYGHLSAIHVVVGQKVKAGDHVADMGNTGFVISGATPFWKHNPYAGTHLHLGLRRVRKSKSGWSYPGSNIKIKVLDYDNGYKGAVDPAPYFSGLTSKQQKMLTIISLQKTVVNLLKQLIARQ